MTTVMTIVGTRPEMIRLSRVITRLDDTVRHVLVHTGQRHDYEHNGVFFDELGTRRPNHYLGVDPSTPTRMRAEILRGAEDVMLAERPDAVLVHGGAASAIAALTAADLGIPVYHVEAGSRCFDDSVAEERNRRLVDHIADYNLAYTEHARANLLAEGLPAGRILMVGSPMKEVLDHHEEFLATSTATGDLGLTEGGYLLVSAHRAENVEAPERLEALLDCLIAARDEFAMPVLASTSAHTRKRLEGLARGADTQRDLSNITFHPPLGFIDYIRLHLDACCVLSDSGTISEESALLGFPAVALRESIESFEALDTGAIILTGLHPQSVIEGAREAITQSAAYRRAVIPTDYEVTNTSERIVRFILSTRHRHGR